MWWPSRCPLWCTWNWCWNGLSTLQGQLERAASTDRSNRNSKCLKELFSSLFEISLEYGFAENPPTVREKEWIETPCQIKEYPLIQIMTLKTIACLSSFFGIAAAATRVSVGVGVARDAAEFVTHLAVDILLFEKGNFVRWLSDRPRECHWRVNAIKQHLFSELPNCLSFSRRNSAATTSSSSDFDTESTVPLRIHFRVRFLCSEIVLVFF